MKRIGSTFAQEIEAAGLLGLPFAWGDDGSFIWGVGITDEMRASVLAVYDAHDPTAVAHTRITRFAPRDFLRRFTMTEYAAARQHTNIAVQWALDNLIGAQYVDITDSDTIAGLDLMVAEGIISEAKRGDLLTPQ